MIKLSSAQKDAVEYLDGPQIILAGAGSGKTRVIVGKAQYLIEKKGYAPDSIYVITYSNKTQAELEERMADLADHPPVIKTFHSFGLDIISEFGRYLKMPADISKADEHRLWQYRKQAIAELIESDLLDNNRPEQIYGEIKGFIDRAKDELVTPDEVIARAEKELSAIIGDDDEATLQRSKWTRVLEAGKIFKSYERIKSESASRSDDSGGIDYGDMIVLTHRLLSSEKEVAASLRKRCRYILVDEFQDANFAQVEILRLVASRECGITVVGDDDQAIYRFRGASFASFRLFQKLFPGYKIFRLEENYRSQANIVRSAQAIIEIDPAARFDADKKMTANKSAGALIAVRKCPDDYSEALSAANEIELLLKNEEYQQPKSIAVLFRTRRHKDMLMSILERKGIDFRYDQRSSEFATVSARLLLALYEFAVDNSRADLLPEIMNHFVPNLNPVIERDINFKLARSGQKPLEVLAQFVADHGNETPFGLDSMIKLLERLKSLVPECSPLQLFERIIVETGIFKALVGDQIDHEAMREISEILKSADKFQVQNSVVTHASFWEYFDWQSSFGESSEELDDSSRVVLQTVHGAKGLEYPVVFVIGLSNQKFPPRKHHVYLEFPAELYKEDLPAGDYRIQEERRLFYVAMTRAMERLYLYGVERKGLKISPFISELTRSPVFGTTGECQTIGQAEAELEIGIGPGQIFVDPQAAVIMPGDKPVDRVIAGSLFELWRRKSAEIKDPDEYLKLKTEFLSMIESGVAKSILEIGMAEFHPVEPVKPYQVGDISYTDITAFQDCPLKFYFRKVLSLPSPSGPQQSLGSVIHAVLEEAGQAMKSGNNPQLDKLVESFEARWKKTFLNDPDRKERLRLRGHDILARFMTIQEAREGVPIETEKTFKFSLVPGAANKQPRLTGRIDRVDKTGRGLEIIDYKTGKQASASDLKKDLQLPIYSLACRDLFGEYPVRVIYMYLGDGTQHEAYYDPESLEKIKAEIRGTIDEINKSDFIATPGHVCENCDFRAVCPARADR